MDDTTAVVTGAGGDLGAAVARRLAEAGAHVVVAASDAADAEAVAAEIGEAGGRATALRADVRDEFDLERVMETAAREGSSGTIDLVVAAAAVRHGAPGATPLHRESYAAFDDHFRANARGVFATVREALAHLAGDARIVVPSAGVAREDPGGWGSYAVSEAAAEAVARGFAADADLAVGVVDVGPVGVETAGEATADEGTRAAEGTALDPEAAAERVLRVARDLPTEHLDGRVVDPEGPERT